MPVLPLSMLRPGKTATIVSVSGGKGLVRRLYDMGFSPGAEVQVVSRGLSGPLLVMVKGSRVALGRGVATRIMVSEAN